MLTLIRSLARSPIIGGFIIVLLIAAFALFGVSDIFRGTGTAAIIVGSERVDVAEVRRAYDRQLQQIQLENPRFTAEQALELGLGESIVQRLTLDAALDAKINELNLTISDEALFEAIRTIPAFQNPFTNEFDYNTYIQVLNQNGYIRGLADRQFEMDMTDELRRNQFINAAFGGINAPDIFSQARQAYAGERRVLRALLIPASMTGDVGQADDETLQTFITENPTFFQRPEQRRVTLVRVQPSDFLNDVEVSEEDLQSLYDFRLDNGELADPATRSLTQWPALDQASAEAAAQRLVTGEAVATVAADLSLGEEVALSEVQAFQVPDTAISQAAFDMTSGEIRAVEGQLGWRVVRVDAATDPVIPSLEDLRIELTEELAGEETQNIMFEALGAFEDARSNGATLEEAAMNSGLFAEKIDFFTNTGYTVDGEPVISMLQSQVIRDAVFAGTQGFDTDTINAGDDLWYALRVDDIIEARLSELDEVREQAAEIWAVRESDDQLQSLVDDAMNRLQSGEAMEDVAVALGGDVRVETSIVGRGETAGPFSAQLVGQAFRAALQTPFDTRASEQTTRAVVVVDQIIAGPVRTTTDSEQQALNAEMQDDAGRVLTAALLNAYEVKADQVLIDQGLGRNQTLQ